MASRRVRWSPQIVTNDGQKCSDSTIEANTSYDADFLTSQQHGAGTKAVTIQSCTRGNTNLQNCPQRIRLFTMAVSLLASLLIAVIVTRFFSLSRDGTPSLLGKNSRLREKPILKFRKEEGDYLYRFKIVQLSDLHLGESITTDRWTWDLVGAILKEENPDLIVLSGDQISADFYHDGNKSTEIYREMGNRLSEFRIPWALVFGDTDDDGLNGSTRQQLLEIDRSFDYSLSEASPSRQIFGTSNYLLNLYVENTAAAQVYLFDSGGGSLPPHLEQSQVKWFSQTNQRLPAVAFQHLPTENFRFQPEKCMGYHDGEDILDTLSFDPGIVDAMSESTRMYFLAAGHNHGNHYCCPFSRWLQVCMGARTGYGGYGDWERGARVYELYMVAPQEHKLEWKSWVRLESGDVYDQVNRYDMRTEKG